jgi:hypothetical protein
VNAWTRRANPIEPRRGDGIEPRVSPRTRGHDARIELNPEGLTALTEVKLLAHSYTNLLTTSCSPQNDVSLG